MYAARCLLVCSLLCGCGDPSSSDDAGTGTDAAIADAGNTDAGPRDGGAVDGGSDGGGGVDGGGLDAGSADAGAPDAGPPVNPLDGVGAVETVQGGFMFLEGPHWREADGALLFTDIPASTIYELTPPSTIVEFRNPSAMANGLASLPDGRLLAAEHGGRRVSVTAPGGAVSTFVGEDASAATFNSPNDLTVRSDGTVYFTDPPYGLAGRPREIAFNGVFRVAPDLAVSVVWMSSSMSQRPNGLALSPDEATLYVADTADGLVRAFPVLADGSTGSESTLISDTPGADGMAVDTAGNLFITTSAGVQVYAADGSRWGTITVPMQPANCAFGDVDHRTLYITARSTLFRVRLVVPGRI